jgi:aconitate hydratase
VRGRPRAAGPLERHLWTALGIDGSETFTVEGLAAGNVKPMQDLMMTFTRADRSARTVPLTLR